MGVGMVLQVRKIAIGFIAKRFMENTRGRRLIPRLALSLFRSGAEPTTQVTTQPRIKNKIIQGWAR